MARHTFGKLRVATATRTVQPAPPETSRNAIVLPSCPWSATPPHQTPPTKNICGHGLQPFDRTTVFLYLCLQRNLIKKTILGNIPNMDVVHQILLTHLHQLPCNCPYRLRVRDNQGSAWGALKKRLRLQRLPARIRRRQVHLCFRGPRAPLLVLEGGDVQLQEKSVETRYL